MSIEELVSTIIWKTARRAQVGRFTDPAMKEKKLYPLPKKTKPLKPSDYQI